MKEYKFFTLSELEYLCKYYEHDSVESIAASLGRTETSIISKVYKLRKNGQFEYYQSLNCHWPDVKVKPWHPGIHKNRHGKWVAECQQNGERFYLGSYWDFKEAKRILERFKQTGVKPPQRLPKYISRFRNGWRVQAPIYLGYYLDFEEAKRVLEQYQLTRVKPPKKQKGANAPDHPWRQINNMEFMRRQQG
jgi:hypothetical protein